MTEYVRVQGRLDRAGGFTVRRAGSTSFVHRWPRGTPHDALVATGAGADGELVLETVDEGGSALHGEVAEVVPEVVCGPEEQTFRVTAYVGLRDDAAAVRVRRGERVLWEAPVPEAPHVDLRLERTPRREEGSVEGEGGEPALLVLDLSEPAEEALARVTVMHQWAERRFATVHVGPPEAEIEIPVGLLPGGERCRFLVTYSNGLRSAVAESDPFELAPAGANVRVLHPADGASVPGEAPLLLEAAVEVREDPAAVRSLAGEPERVVWLVDGEHRTEGLIASVDRLEPGRHEIAAVYRGDDGPVEARVTVEVREPEGPTADEWPAWETVPGSHG